MIRYQIQAPYVHTAHGVSSYDVFPEIMPSPARMLQHSALVFAAPQKASILRSVRTTATAASEAASIERTAVVVVVHAGSARSTLHVGTHRSCHVRCLDLALWCCDCGEFDWLTFREGAELLGMDGGLMHEDIGRSILRRDEAESLLGVEPLDGSILHHVGEGAHAHEGGCLLRSKHGACKAGGKDGTEHGGCC